MTPCAQGGTERLLKSTEMWRIQVIAVERFAAEVLSAAGMRRFLVFSPTTISTTARQSEPLC